MIEKYLQILNNLNLSTEEKYLVKTTKKITHINIIYIFNLLKKNNLLPEAIQMFTHYLNKKPNNIYLIIKFSHLLYNENLFKEAWIYLNPKRDFIYQNKEAIRVYIRLCLILFKFNELRIFTNKIDTNFDKTDKVLSDTLSSNNFKQSRALFLENEFKQQEKIEKNIQSELTATLCYEHSKNIVLKKNIFKIKYLHERKTTPPSTNKPENLEELKVVKKQILLDNLFLFQNIIKKI
jgi:hypothetical protein